METRKGQSLDQFWQWDTTKVFQLLRCNTEGLSEKDASENLKRYGPNLQKAITNRSTFFLLLSQFKSPVTLLLIAAAILSAILGDVSDMTIILIIVLISSILGFWQEKGAASAVETLLKLVQINSSVFRGGKLKEIPLEKIVPGDVVSLCAGDIIPGDCLVVDAQDLFVDEAAFTGETYPVEKQPGVVGAETILAKRTNTLYMGSHVVSGKAKALVVKTGKSTEFGKISSSLKIRPPETDFENGIKRFGYMLMEVTMVLVVMIFAINVLLHKPALDSFLFSLALAVGLTPQLLPAIISVNLSVGARNMAKKQVIVKRLSSIENFGSMTILCSDKTGTITEGKVKLKDALDIAGKHSDKVLKLAWINAVMQRGFHNPIDAAIGEAYAGKPEDYAVKTEIPYDFVRKRLTIQISSAEGDFAITKGSVNNILSICDRVETSPGKLENIDTSRDRILMQYQELSNAGYRTLGVAYKISEGDRGFTKTDESGMIFLGFIVLYDPPKNNIQSTINDLQKLGVKLKLITGDNALVAQSLALQIGMESPKVLSGADMRKMSNAALLHNALRTDVFAEVEPDQKERIISVLKKSGNVVGFMGDGINDASALHVADVGISVHSAVDVAKQAADIVLLDQSLDVLADGIIEGRKTFVNTMKYIFMATSANFGNMFSMAGASLIMPFLPLLPKQILLTNLLTDLPEMAISTDKVDEVQIYLPQKWDLGFIRRFMLVFGLLSSVFDYLTFGVLLFFMHFNEVRFQTGWFTESVISAILIVLVVRTKRPFFKSLPGRLLNIATGIILLVVLILPVSPLVTVFGFQPLPVVYYAWIILIISLYLLSAELLKRWFYNKLAKRLKK